jgi:seryl-tRNA synthetase
LDLRRIRKDPEGVRAALARRDPSLAAAIDEVLVKDREWRAATTSAESTRATQKERSEAFAAARSRGEDDPGLRAQMQEMSAQVKAFSEQAESAKRTLDELMRTLPNLPASDAAPGPEDALVRTVGEPPSFDFQPRDHLELAGPAIDMERAARLSGARFAYLRGDLVLVELALVRWVLDILRSHGFEPVIPPVLVREQALYGTGFLPDTEQQIYALAEDDLYLLGTSEVALASLHAEEIVDAERLPLRYAGFSSCFRREAGAAGRDTRGIFRVHQFDKVEMFSFVAPEESPAEHERLLAIEEHILQQLGLPYRVVNIAVGDLGSSAAIKYDCEAYLPSQSRYRELTSCSNTTDFQARRLNVRMRATKPGAPGKGEGAGSDRGGRGLEPLHTLNGTAVAVGRTLVALLENGQQADASVVLPEVLVPYGAPARLDPAG